MKKSHSSRSNLIVVALFLLALSFLLPALQAGNGELYLLAAAVPGVLLLFVLIPGRIFSLDLPSVTISLILCSFSVLAFAAADSGKAVHQGIICLISLFFLLVGPVLLRAFRPSLPASLSLAVIAGLLLSLPLLHPALSLSLMESALALLLFSFVSVLSLKMRLPAFLISLTGIVLLLLQKSPIFAAVWGFTCILVFWACSGSALWSALTAGTSLALFTGFYAFTGWPSDFFRDPSLSSIPRIGLFSPVTPPENPVSLSENPSVFLLLGDQYGLIFLLCILLLLLVLLFRCSFVARCARSFFHASMALGVMLLLGLRMLAFLLSLAEILSPPVTDLPFVTVSLPDLAGQMLLLGLLSGVSAKNRENLTEDTHLAMLAR